MKAATYLWKYTNRQGYLLAVVHTAVYYRRIIPSHFSHQKKNVRERLPLLWRRPTAVLLPRGRTIRVAYHYSPHAHISLSLSRYLPACAPNVSSKVVRTARVSHVPSLGEASGARLLFYTISPLLLPVVSDNGRNISISRDRG